MSVPPKIGGWLRGPTTIKKAAGVASAITARATSSATNQAQNSTVTLYAGGVKDPSGKTSEYSVSLNLQLLSLYHSLTVGASLWMTSVLSARVTAI